MATRGYRENARAYSGRLSGCMVVLQGAALRMTRRTDVVDICLQDFSDVNHYSILSISISSSCREIYKSLSIKINPNEAFARSVAIALNSSSYE